MSPQIQIPAQGWTRKQQGNLNLYLPTSKANFDGPNRWLRSIILNRDGNIVSLGLPKFQSPTRDPRLWEEMIQQKEKPIILRKMDGSLLLRSVDRGKVLWRTRGGFDLGGFSQRIHLWLQHNPAGEKLIDPEFMPDHTLWMEWLDPIQRVVVQHTEGDLILLGGVNNTNLRELSRKQIEIIANELTWRATDIIAWPAGREIADIPEWVDAKFKDEEGVVLLWESTDGKNNDRIRVKSSRYLHEHAKRFQYNPTVILNAYLKSQGNSKKGKAKKRQGSVYENTLRRLQLNSESDPVTLQWVQTCVSEIEKLEAEIEEEWLNLLHRGKTGSLKGDDAVQNAVLKGIHKGGKSKALLQHHRRHTWIQSRSGG